MAIAFVNLGVTAGAPAARANPDIHDSSNATSYANDSWTPPTTGIVCIFIQSRRNGGPDTPAVTGGGTWTQIGSTFDCDGGGNGLSLFAIYGTDTSTAVTTIGFGSNTQVHCVGSFFQITGADEAGAITAAFVQNATNSGSGAPPNGVTLAAFADTDNRALACFWHKTNELSTPGTDFVELDDMTGPGQNRGVITIYRGDAADTSPDATWATTSDWGGFAVEVKDGTVATPTYNQTAFRIRAGDTVGINVDSDWAAAQNVNATINCHHRFRIRIEMEEDASVGGSKQFELRFSHNSGAYTLCEYYNLADAAGNTITPRVWVGESSEYADGAATTNELTGNAKTFVAGDGNEDPLTAAIDLNNEHTEWEFTIVIPTFWAATSNNQNVDTDTFDFRLYESGGTVFDTYDETPRITLNVPDFYIGGTYVETPNTIGPFVDGNQNLYFAIENAADGTPASTAGLWAMIKSTDNGASWTEQDRAGAPGQNDLEAVDIVQVDDTLHTLHHRGPQVNYNTFHMSSHGTTPDTWVINEEDIITITEPTQQSCAITVMSDGDVWAFFTRDVSATQEVSYVRRNGTWGSATDVDTGSNNFVSVTAVLGDNDLTHIFYKDQNGHDIFHRTLSAASSLSGPDTVTTDAHQNGRHPFAPAIYYDDGGVEVIVIAYAEQTDGQMYTRYYRDNTPQSPTVASDNAVEVSPPSGPTSEQPVAFIANNGTNVFLRYSHATNNDIYEDENADEGGWGTDTAELTGIKTIYVRGRVIVHSGGTVLGYIYEDSEDTGVVNTDGGFTGGIKYGEFVIAAAGAAVKDIIGVGIIPFAR